jgi:glycosyltransferase involved in cell wall biosynthesis
MADVSAVMKIVFLLQDTGSVYGAERATLGLACGLRARGIDASALLIVETRLGLAKSGLQDALAAAGIPFSTIATASRFSWRLTSEIADALRSQKADVVHSTGYKSDIHGLFAARAAKIPQVSTVHGWLFRPDLKERFYAWLNVQAFKSCARVIALSRFYENLLREKGVPRVERIPTGFLLSPEAAGMKNERTFTFGMLGRLSWEKNHGLFLDAAARLRDRKISARFLIGGDGPERAAIASRASALKLNIELPGYVATSEFLAQTDSLVICSRIENQPLVVMEAMARAIPVIATNVGGLPDLVGDGVTGLLVPADDVEALAGAMAKFCERPQDAAVLGRAGREKLARDFGHDEWIARHVALYESCENQDVRDNFQ